MEHILPKMDCDISAIVAFESFEYTSNFIYKNEYRDCWMLYYVESGELELSFSNQYTKNVILPNGHLFIQPPNSDYSYRSHTMEGVRVTTIGFQCSCNSLRLIASSNLALTPELSAYLSFIQQEFRSSFSPIIHTDGTLTMERTLLQPFGGEQLICNYLEILIIQLIRKSPDSGLRTALTPEQADQILFRKITRYYRSHLTSYLSLEEICKEFQIGQAHLQRIFRTHTNMGAIEYFCNLRIDAAKKLMREEYTSIQETAARMGYHTTHYFSKQFKQISGMTPSAYIKLINSSNSNPFRTDHL